MRLQDHCRGCGAPLSRTVFQMDAMPLAGAFAETAEEAVAAQRLPLTWLQCDSCELVQVAEDVPDDILYGNYCYASSTVPSLVAHFKDYAAFLAKRFPSPQRVLEMGCNDGVLLRQLPSTWDRVGVDPSDVAVRAAQDDAYLLVNEPFGTDLVLRSYDLVIASNCLAHVSDIADCVEAAARALRPGGEFWVEVHDLEETLRTGQWDTVYHEHKAEYSARSLSRVVVPHGFSVIFISRHPLHGGLLRMGFLKDEIGQPFAGERWTDFAMLQESYEQRRDTDLYHQLECATDASEPLIAYGAAGRATIWFNQLSELRFDAVVDDSPLRAGRFVPGVGWPIVAWEDRPPSAACVITAWNYADAIRARRNYEGRWLQTWGAA